jgi:hypothetical protein
MKIETSVNVWYDLRVEKYYILPNKKIFSNKKYFFLRAYKVQDILFKFVLFIRFHR